MLRNEKSPLTISGPEFSQPIALPIDNALSAQPHVLKSGKIRSAYNRIWFELQSCFHGVKIFVKTIPHASVGRCVHQVHLDALEVYDGHFCQADRRFESIRIVHYDLGHDVKEELILGKVWVFGPQSVKIRP